MVEPSFLADTCTPSSFWPEAEVIEPVSSWSADAPLAANPTTRPATLANSLPRICVMMGISCLRLGVMALFGRWAACRAGRRGLDRHGADVGNNRLDLIRLQVVLEGGHARRAVGDELAHDIVVAAAGFLVERRAVGLGAERGRQMADPARLGEHLPP